MIRSDLCLWTQSQAEAWQGQDLVSHLVFRDQIFEDFPWDKKTTCFLLPRLPRSPRSFWLHFKNMFKHQNHFLQIIFVAHSIYNTLWRHNSGLWKGRSWSPTYGATSSPEASPETHCRAPKNRFRPEDLIH